MPEMYLRFTQSACEPLTKIKTRIQKLKATEYFNYMYTNEQEKACFQYSVKNGT